jgi:hypothetical protein
VVTVADARLVARDWVARQAGPELVGAFLAGSSAVGAGAVELAATSDVDLIMVTAGEAPAKVGKLWHDGVLLDVSSLSSAELDPETIAGTSYLAPFFTDSMIIHDPSGALATLHARVRELVDQPVWIRRRVAEVRAKITNGLADPDPTLPLARQVISWVFSASLPTVQLLVAAGRPPTVRKRYLRCRQLLTETPAAPPGLYQGLLGALGCADTTTDQVRRHLDVLADTLQVTASYARTPFPFSSDLRPDTWHIALDGSAELVDAGWPREAVWWLLATAARCATVLAADAPAEVAARHEERLADAAADLIGFGFGDAPGRTADVLTLLPEVDALVEELIVSGAE